MGKINVKEGREKIKEHLRVWIGNVRWSKGQREKEQVMEIKFTLKGEHNLKLNLLKEFEESENNNNIIVMANWTGIMGD